MSNSLKALGLAVVAAFAMSAVVASSASAQTVEAELESPTGFATATSTSDVFTAGGSQVTCNHAEFSGAFTSPTKKLSITPKYTGCTAFGIANTHILDTGCTFDFTLKNEHSTGLTKGKATVKLNCGEPATGHIVMTPTWPVFGGSVCTITFTTQNVAGELGVTVLTAPNPDDLQVDAGTVGGGAITYNVSQTGLGCPSLGHHADGNYHVSQTTVRGYSNAAHTAQVGGKLVTNP